MNQELYYPAIFTPEDDGRYSVSFPDFPGCNTFGDNLENAYDMAFDALGIMLTYLEEEHMPIPQASDPSSFEMEKGQFTAIIKFNLIEYKKRVSNKAVKKTLSIPEWLNEAALEANINFSNVLQEALKQKLGIN